MNSKKDNEDQDDKNSNDNNAKKNDKSTENSDDSNLFDISNNDGKGDKSDNKGDKSDNSRFTNYSSTRSPRPKGKSTSSPSSKDSNYFKQKINNERKGITKKINRYKVGSINKKIIFSAIGIIAVAVIIMILSQGSNFKFNQEAVTEAKDLEISLKNVSITNIDNNNIKVNTIFDVIIQIKEL